PSSTTLLDSTIPFSPCARIFFTIPAARGRSPARDRNQNDRSAPAARYRPVSVPFGSYSSLTANSSPVSASQPHAFPSCAQTPWPYCVILTAVHLRSRSLRINPATTLVFPRLRECPPTTTSIRRSSPAPPAGASIPPLRGAAPADGQGSPVAPGAASADAPACPRPSRPSPRSWKSPRSSRTPA